MSCCQREDSLQYGKDLLSFVTAVSVSAAAAALGPSALEALGPWCLMVRCIAHDDVMNMRIARKLEAYTRLI